MESLSFQCKTISPMLLSGADGRSPEFRPASLKGVLRFWWRASQGHLDLKTLSEHEALLFGGTQNNGRKSPLFLKSASPFLRQSSHVMASPTPHKKRPNGKPFQLPSFDKNQPFGIQFYLRNSADWKESPFQADLALYRRVFFLVSLLGGLGKRSRRGFGAFQIQQVEGQESPKGIDASLVHEALTALNPRYRLQRDGIEMAFKGDGTRPFIRSIELGQSYPTVERLLHEIGETTHRFNSRRDRSLGSANPRFASPVVVSMVQNQSGAGTTFLPIITTLNMPRATSRDLDNQKRFKEALLQ